MAATLSRQMIVSMGEIFFKQSCLKIYYYVNNFRGLIKNLCHDKKKIFYFNFLKKSCENLQVRPIAIDLCNKIFLLLLAEN